MLVNWGPKDRLWPRMRKETINRTNLIVTRLSPLYRIRPALALMLHQRRACMAQRRTVGSGNGARLLLIWAIVERPVRHLFSQNARADATSEWQPQLRVQYASSRDRDLLRISNQPERSHVRRTLSLRFIHSTSNTRRICSRSSL